MYLLDHDRVFDPGESLSRSWGKISRLGSKPLSDFDPELVSSCTFCPGVSRFVDGAAIICFAVDSSDISKWYPWTADAFIATSFQLQQVDLPQLCGDDIVTSKTDIFEHAVV